MRITCNINRKEFLFSLVFASFLLCPLVHGEIERFIPAQDGDKEVWRITHDPIVRDWANYHNTDAWSPDGRYICYTHYAANDEMYGRSEAAEVHIVDLHTGEDRTVDHGTDPRWANNYNWLFYVKFIPENDSRNGKGSQVMCLNVDTGELTRIAYGVPNLGETDCDDRWIYGYKNSETWGRRSGVRIPIRANSRVEHLEGLHGIQWVGNPVHPVIFCRKDHRDSEGRPLFFEATRYWFDPEGDTIAIGSPMVERCHQSWSGDGKYYLLGNSQMRGRLWNEPFPSNLHLLSAVRCGDISPCGKSGRWVCGSSSYGSFPIADLRSGDGETCLQAFSVIAYPGDFDASGPYDNDAKGSPDGTKIVFVSNYDLKDGPLAEITIDAESDSRSLVVDSTDGFPDKGRLLLVDGFRREVLSYESKTPNRFKGLKRGLYRTPIATPRKGKILTSFDARVTSAEEWEERNLAQPAPYMLESVEDPNSPLARQHQTDVYLVVVRKPDTPYLWENTRIELIPGENHWETFGYHIYKDGEKITESPLRPEARFPLPGSGSYTAVAVEYSGLESEQSLPLEIKEEGLLYVRSDKPADFSWTQDKWLVDGEQVSIETAMNTAEALKEIVHRYDGVIHREWYSWGQKTKRHDLNHEGKAIRRLFYRGDRLAKRAYFDRQGHQRSLEYFGEDGYMTEKILFGYNDNGERVEETHWWYEEGMPLKLIGRGGYAVGPPGHYVKKGDDFVRID